MTTTQTATVTAARASHLLSAARMETTSAYNRTALPDDTYRAVNRHMRDAANHLNHARSPKPQPGHVDAARSLTLAAFRYLAAAYRDDNAARTPEVAAAVESIATTLAALHLIAD